MTNTNDADWQADWAIEIDRGRLAPDGSLVDAINALTRAQQALATLTSKHVYDIEFAEDGIAAIARIAAEVNSTLENIGARRLQTVMEKLLEDVSFHAEDRRGERLVIDRSYVSAQLDAVAKDVDLSKYVL